MICNVLLPCLGFIKCIRLLSNNASTEDLATLRAGRGVRFTACIGIPTAQDNARPQKCTRTANVTPAVWQRLNTKMWRLEYTKIGTTIYYKFLYYSNINNNEILIIYKTSGLFIRKRFERA